MWHKTLASHVTPCLTDFDCSLNGICTTSQCVCMRPGQAPLAYQERIFLTTRTRATRGVAPSWDQAMTENFTHTSLSIKKAHYGTLRRASTALQIFPRGLGTGTLPPISLLALRTYSNPPCSATVAHSLTLSSLTARYERARKAALPKASPTAPAVVSMPPA